MTRWPVLQIGLFAPKKNRRDFDRAGLVGDGKNQAIPTGTFSVSPNPLFSLQRLDVALKGIFRHLLEAPTEERLVVSRKFLKLFCAFVCELDGPGHVRVGLR